MAFNVFEDEALMAEFDRISAEPIDNEPYSLVHNPKPVVESILDFNGHKIDTGSWCCGDGVCEDKKKVGKAKTATDPKLTKQSSANKEGEKKEDGKVVENVDAKEKKNAGKTTEVKTNTEVKTDKAPKAGSGSSFDSAAKSAATDNRKGADDNKKFVDGAKLQKSIDIFKKSVRALATDSKTAADAEKVLKKFDKISSYLKPKMESVYGSTELSDEQQKFIKDGVASYVKEWCNSPSSSGSSPDTIGTVQYVDKLMEEQHPDWDIKGDVYMNAVKTALSDCISHGNCVKSANPEG